MKSRFMAMMMAIVICMTMIPTTIFAQENASLYTGEQCRFICQNYKDKERLLDVLCKKESFGYWTTIQDCESLSWALSLASSLIDEKPSEEDYAKILANLVAMQSGSLAEQIQEQSRFDDLKTGIDYAEDVIDIALEYMGGAGLTKTISPILDAVWGGKDFLVDGVESARYYKMTLQDYAESQKFLELISDYAEDEVLREVAESLLTANEKLLEKRLEYLKNVTGSAIKYEGKFFLFNLSADLLKDTKLYESDKIVHGFVDGFADVLNAVPAGHFVFKTMMLVGDIGVGTTDTFKRYQEMCILSNIADVIAKAVNAINIPKDSYTDEVMTNIHTKCDYYKMLLAIHARGEYLAYKLVTNDAGILSDIKGIIDAFKTPEETADAWYKAQVTAMTEYYDILDEMFNVSTDKAERALNGGADIPTDAVEFNGHRYYLYDFAGLAEPTQNTWENAQAYCEAVGGYLATITTPEENDFLYRYMRQRGYASAYFGLSNTKTGVWQWGNGELLSYTNWHSGEPNNQNGNEHYGMFYVNFPDGTWNDGKFDAPYTEPQQERQDIVSTVTASSYLPAGATESYEPTNVLDGNLATAWAEGKGTGETISFTFDDSYRIGGIVISAGYQKSDELYEANSRPAEIRVIGDDGFEQRCSVQDLNGRQEVVFNQFANTRSLSVTIENIYEGRDYSDTCISEIAFLVGGGVSGSSDGGTAFLCEWGEPTETGDTPDNSSQMQPMDGERSIALVLDTSGSMSGTPIEETRKAASNFVFSVLPENAAVGVVTYTEYAQVRTDFTMDSSKLEEIVSNLSAGGGTNIDDGLKQAYNMLQRTSSKKKIIILMSDGEPNNGRTGDELIAFADEIKQSGVYIYTLGFFDALGDRTSAQYLMERLASDGCHYEVSSAEDLVFFFGDIASQINGQKYIYIRIACPVDVTVSYGGETLTSAEGALNTRTDFGTLTFEDSEKTTDAAQTDQVKILRLKEGVDYDVKITGTGYGMMDYTIGFMDDDGQYSDLRYFEDIRITRNTMIEATAAVSDQSVLKVDTDGDGRFDIAYRAGQNEHAQQTKVIPWLTVTLVVAGTVVLAVVLVVILLKKKKKRKVR